MGTLSKWGKNLTKKEAQETERFLLEHPELIEHIREEKKEWTEEEIIECACRLVKVEPSVRNSIEQLHRSFELRHPTNHLHLPPRLVPSTMMSDKVYPLAGQLKGSVIRLKESPGRITILGVGRKTLAWVPLGLLGEIPIYLRPVDNKSIPEIEAPIPQGRRWNTLYKQVMENRYLEREVLLFQARTLCIPPLESEKVEDLVAILGVKRERREERGPREEALEVGACEKMAEHLRGRWIFRLPDKEWYRYEDDHWSTRDSSSYELMNDIFMEIKRMGGEYTKAERIKMGTLKFRKLVEENLRQLLYCTPTPLKGLHFLNGLLVEDEDDGIRLLPIKPGLFELMDGDILKINLLRIFLRLLFTQNNKEQVSLYLWGPGATGKSTLVQLLEYIMGEACCALDVLRLNNRFEMRAIQDKYLITVYLCQQLITGFIYSLYYIQYTCVNS